ncbi:hypothetical protein ACQKNC_20705 [Lysinibacillus sp. NPDC094177]
MLSVATNPIRHPDISFRRWRSSFRRSETSFRRCDLAFRRH